MCQSHANAGSRMEQPGGMKRSTIHCGSLGAWALRNAHTGTRPHRESVIAE